MGSMGGVTWGLYQAGLRLTRDRGVDVCVGSVEWNEGCLGWPLLVVGLNFSEQREDKIYCMWHSSGVCW